MQTIPVSRAAIQGERKLVTVLFVDVAGFTAVSGKLDPEGVHQAHGRRVRADADRSPPIRGTVNQFLGDGLMALFGVPIAHEDPAARAVRAALGIQHAPAGYGVQLA